MDAEGVHLGQSDLPIHVARRILGADKIVGATAKTVPQAREAYEQGADYLGVGAIYPTTTKVKTVLTSTDTPVSYTHLDVYKRQIPYSSATSLAMGPAITMATVLLAVAMSLSLIHI